MMLHRANTAGNLPSSGVGNGMPIGGAVAATNGLVGTTSRAASPRLMKPDLRENSVIEERDRNGRVVARYRVGRLLGRGGFAKCFEFTDMDTPNAPTLACKVIDRASLQKSKTLQKLHSEIAIHKRMKHKHIVNFLKNFQDEWYVYILLEKCSNQTLMEVAKTRSRFTVQETQHIMLQAIAAIQYMHDQYVIHRDLKLGNMMMDAEMNVKIGDFGLAAELQYDGERKRTICGTPNYIAPEILEGHRDGHSFEVDVWSLGVILYTLLVGEPPFQTADVKTTYDRIKRCRYEFPPNVNISESGKELVHKILQSRPDKRPSLVEIRSDPFFRNPAPPAIAPITLFPDHIRRRLEREGYGSGSQQPSTAGGMLNVVNVNTGLSAPPPVLSRPTTTDAVPVRPLWSAGSSAPSSSAAASSARTSARGEGTAAIGAASSARSATTTPSVAPLPSYGAPAPLSSDVAPVRPRTGSIPAYPTATATSRPASSGTGTGYGAWCAATSDPSAPSSARAAAVPTPSSVVPPPPAVASAATAKRQLEDDEEKHHLTAIHDKLQQSLLGQAERDDASPILPPSVWITDYADFSAKYGMSYRLSTGHTGVHFNDSTKMVWEPITGRCEYYARVKETVNGIVHAQDKRESFVMDTFPESLTKKVTLIKYFKSYLARGRNAAPAKDGVEVVSSPCLSVPPALLSEPNMVADMVYVKRWIVNPEAVIFRLSNKTIQVAFRDRAEVILSSESKVVTYTDAAGRRKTMLLSAVAAQSEEISNRLKYTRDILSRLINNREL